MKWDIVVSTMYPLGYTGEHMVITATNAQGEHKVMCAPKIRNFGALINDAIFMSSGKVGSDAEGLNEIDEFLQAMMDVAWQRGLRPTPKTE